MRLVNLDAYTGKFDEGIRAEQLLLMSAGFRPVRDIFAAQGPLSLDIFFPSYLLFGQTLAAARAAVIVYSLLGMLAVYWVGSLCAGKSSGALSAALLLVSPIYLKNSRLALLEVPALVPAICALGAALLFQKAGRRRWLVVSAVALALALSIKPMVLPVVLPLGLTLLLRKQRRLSDVLLYGLVTAMVGLLVVGLYGPEQVWQQVVSYRASARQAAGWSLHENWSIMLAELRDEPLALYVLGAASSVYLALRQPRWGLPLASWPLANFGLLLVYSPLQFKHVAILFPPLALAVGAAQADLLGRSADWRSDLSKGAARGFPLLDRLVTAARTVGRRDRGLPARVVALSLGLWYLLSLPGALRQDWLVMSAVTENRVEAYAEESQLIAALTRPTDFVLADDPIVAFDSRRLVPPYLVDTSSYRLRSGALSGGDVVAAAERYDTRVLFLFSNGLRDLKRFDEYVSERYRAIKIAERLNAKDRALYLRDDSDFAIARTLLSRQVDQVVQVDFGGDLRLLGYNLARDELRPGASTTLTAQWEAIRPMASDYHVVTHLRGPTGQPDLQSERALGGGGEGTRSWESGRWVFRSQVLTIPPRTAPGDYQLSLALYDSRSRVTPPVTSGGEAGSTEAPLGFVRIR